MSSIPNNVIAEAILKLNAGEKLTDEQVSTLRAFLPAVPAVAAEPVAVAAEPVAVAEAVAETKKPRKAKTTKATAKVENELLIPVDAEVPTATAVATAVANAVATAVATEAQVADDPLRGHSSRLAVVDATLCQGRRIDEKNPIVGTRKDDEGSNGMFYPEKQCSKKPTPGQKLCNICAKKDEVAKTTTTVDKTWYGRLDEPLYHNAKIVGCKHFFEKYPTGLKNDPTTHAAVPEVVVAKKAKKAKVAGKKEADTEAVAVALTSVAPKTVEWITFLHEGKPHIRNTSDGKVYMCDLSKSTREDSVVSENFVGRWTDGALDKFATEDDE
jgi:hypothetical protein